MVALELLRRRDKLVAAQLVVRSLEKLSNLYPKIVRVEHRKLRDAGETFATVRQDVGEGANDVREVRPERTHRTDRSRTVKCKMVQSGLPVARLRMHDDGRRQILDEVRRNADRA